MQQNADRRKVAALRIAERSTAASHHRPKKWPIHMSPANEFINSPLRPFLCGEKQKNPQRIGGPRAIDTIGDKIIIYLFCLGNYCR